MANQPQATSTPIDNARALLLNQSGRVSGASVLVSNALQGLDEARANGTAKMSDVARERIARAALEAADKLNAFRREIDELIINQ